MKPMMTQIALRMRMTYCLKFLLLIFRLRRFRADRIPLSTIKILPLYCCTHRYATQFLVLQCPLFFQMNTTKL